MTDVVGKNGKINGIFGGASFAGRRFVLFL